MINKKGDKQHYHSTSQQLQETQLESSLCLFICICQLHSFSHMFTYEELGCTMITFKHKSAPSSINYDNFTTVRIFIIHIIHFINILTHESCVQLMWIHRIQVPTCVTLHTKASLPWGNKCSAFYPTFSLISFFWLVAEFFRLTSWPYLSLTTIFRDSGQLWIPPFAIVYISILLFYCATPGNERKANKKGGIWTYIVR